MRFTTRRYWTWIVWTFFPPAGSMATASFRRRLGISVLWLLLVPLMLLHRVCLALDHLLFWGWRHIEPRRPLWVVGVPRSGTTLVHRLLAADPQFTTMPLWELILAPSLLQKNLLRVCARIDRLCGSPLRRMLGWLERRFLGGLSSIHSTSLWTPEEDYLALAVVAACFILIQPFPFPELWTLTDIDRALTDRERERLMRFYRGIVQRHLAFRGEKLIYLAKNPTFTGAIDTLRTTFPEARFIVCVREPLAVCGSLVNSMTWGAVAFGNRPTHAGLRDRLLEMLQRYFQRAVDIARADRTDARVIRFDDLVVRTGECVFGGLALLGYDASAIDTVAVRTALERCARYRTSHRYDLRDYELEPGQIRKDFRFAIEEFAWDPEDS